MRKLLVALAVGLLAAALAAPSHAADFKYTGFYRIRGITSDNTDRNDNAHDGVQGYDALARPRFTATSEGGKIWAIYELDFDTGNYIIGTRTGRSTVGTNRWLVDFAIPGTTLRARFGKTDYTDPSREIYDSLGRGRKDGMAIYGKLTSNLSLSAFTSKTYERVNAGTRFSVSASDRDNYLVALKWKAAPNVELTPWFAASHKNQNRARGIANEDPTNANGHDLYYMAVTGKAKIGILSANVTGVYEDGKVAEYYRGFTPASDVDIQAWALLVRLWATFGKLKLGFYTTYLTGDDDRVTSTSVQAPQSDKELNRFVFPDLNGWGWVDAPQIVTSRWMGGFSTIGGRVPGVTTSPTLNQLNGALIFEARAQYMATKTLQLLAGLGFVNAAKKKANICTDANANGVCDGTDPTTTQYKSSKNFGTELDVGFRWHIYKELELRAAFAYLWAGDYGRVQGSSSFDDTWQAFYELRYAF